MMRLGQHRGWLPPDHVEERPARSGDLLERDQGELDRHLQRASPRGDRVGRLYLQYWLYYPGSATARALLGDAGAHPDDWESFQVRIGPDGAVDARASSHHGYNGDSGDWLSDSGLVEKAGWTASTGRYFISGGSHAGRVGDRAATGRGSRGMAMRPGRWTDARAIRLVPIEALAGGAWEFAVSPPWEKRVYRDPEHKGTE